MPKKNISVNKLNYEQAFSELETIVATLESEQPSLEEAISLFERGQSLSQRCADLLEQAELKIQQLGGEDLFPMEDRERD